MTIIIITPVPKDPKKQAEDAPEYEVHATDGATKREQREILRAALKELRED